MDAADVDWLRLRHDEAALLDDVDLRKIGSTTLSLL